MFKNSNFCVIALHRVSLQGLPVMSDTCCRCSSPSPIALAVGRDSGKALVCHSILSAFTSSPYIQSGGRPAVDSGRPKTNTTMSRLSPMAPAPLFPPPPPPPPFSTMPPTVTAPSISCTICMGMLDQPGSQLVSCSHGHHGAASHSPSSGEESPVECTKQAAPRSTPTKAAWVSWGAGVHISLVQRACRMFLIEIELTASGLYIDVTEVRDW